MQLLKRRAWKWKQSRVVLADCEKPKKFPEEKSKSFVKKINDRRRLMVQGKQKNGRLPSFLPLGENVVEMEWSCGLEKLAISALKNCSQSVAVPKGKKGFLY
ncbi:hypothetical protein Y032_0030g2156 [Ancylostoma ceylanicum]|uniref:Uncharacterized protein n=1 Tax=Ancylostoma ceylanicum TaxID=53326 RepID=A0A016UQC0_9BILA|nr:hypothetical protein Y032_0030g2156 [Ancylostoma ceylanicum]